MPHRNQNTSDLFANHVWAVGAILAFMLTAEHLSDANLPEEANVKQQIGKVIDKICNWVQFCMHISMSVKSYAVAAV